MRHKKQIKKSMNILIYGFGRMGLTHFSILNSLNKNINFTVVEPNKILRKILNKNINAKFYSNDLRLKEPFDITLITTPPFIHFELAQNSIKRGDKKVFVEKPFGGHTNVKLNTNLKGIEVFVGYVLRFNPCIQWIKNNIDNTKIKSIHGQYLSNTIEKKPKGWRNSLYSGVLNEMGSHILDLIQYITNERQFNVISSNIKSVVTDIDDIVDAKLESDKKTVASIYINWVKKDVRKPIFSLEIEMNDGLKYFIDQQQIKIFNNNKLFKTVSATDLITKVPYYLRGVDFTNQMIDLLGQTKKTANVEQALAVNKMMNQIYNYENITRR